MATGAAKALSPRALNAAIGAPCSWASGGIELVCRFIPEGRGAPPAESAPKGPATQDAVGRVAPNRTFQDLLASPHDEALFAHYFARQWMVVGLDGQAVAVGTPGLVTSLDPSPDGRYFIAETVQRPFSYQVTWGRFPVRTAIWDRSGREVRLLRNVTQVETQSIARGATTPGPRGWRWRRLRSRLAPNTASDRTHHAGGESHDPNTGDHCGSSLALQHSKRADATDAHARQPDHAGRNPR